MKNILTIVVLFLTTISLAGKNIEFGKIAKEELEESVHPLEKEAKSAVLYQEAISTIEFRDTEGTFVVRTEYFTRIKIYDATDANLGSVKIPYYSSGQYKEKISGLKAVTYNLENGKIEKSKLSKGEVFQEKTTSNYKTQKFAMPNVKAGSVFEYKYTLNSPAYNDIPKFQFQYKIPVKESLFTLEVPEYFEFNISTKGTVPLNASDERVSRKITVTSTSENSYMMGGRGEKRTNYGSIDYSAKLYTFQHTNTPSLPDEDFVPYMRNYRSAVIFELLATRFPNSPVKNYTSSWDKIAELLTNHSEFGRQIGKKLKDSKFELDVSAVEKPLDVAKMVYYNVRDKVNWNNKYGVLSKDGLFEFIRESTGNAADINLLLTNQLQKHNIVAYPVVMRTRDYGFMNHYYPTLDDLNYVIVYAEIDGKGYFLDATDQSSMFGNLPDRALNRKGVIVIEKTGKLVDIMNPNINKVQEIVKGTFQEDWSVVLDCKSKYKNYATKQALKDSQQYEDMGKWMETIESENENVEYNSISLDSENIDPKGVTLNENFVLSDIAEEIDGKIYINSLLNKNIETNPFVDEKREYPIFFNHIKDESITIQLEVPEGYQVASVPEEQVVTLPDDKGMFSYSVNNMGNKLVIQSRLKLSTDMIAPDVYPYVRELYDLVVAKGKEKIVLSK